MSAANGRLRTAESHTFDVPAHVRNSRAGCREAMFYAMAASGLSTPLRHFGKKKQKPSS